MCTRALVIAICLAGGSALAEERPVLAPPAPTSSAAVAVPQATLLAPAAAAATPPAPDPASLDDPYGTPPAAMTAPTPPAPAASAVAAVPVATKDASAPAQPYYKRPLFWVGIAVGAVVLGALCWGVAWEATQTPRYALVRF